MLRASCAPQSLQIHKQKVAEAHNGEEDVLDGAEPRAVGVCVQWTEVSVALLYWDLTYWGNCYAPALQFCCS